MSHEGECFIHILLIHCVCSVVVVVVVVAVAAVVDSKSNKCALLLILLVQPLTTVPFDNRHGICVLISCRCSPNRGMTLFKHTCVVLVGAA